MKRTKINQIFAWLALFAIFFGVISTAIMIVVTPETTQIEDSQSNGIDEFLKNYSGSVQVVTGSTSTGTQTLTGKIQK